MPLQAAPHAVQSKIKSMCDAVGIQTAADHLGISYESLKSVYGGLRVRAGTIALIEKNIGKPAPKAKPKKKGKKK